MTARLTSMVVCAVLLGACGDDGGGGAAPETPALLVERARDVAQTDDFLRIVYLPAGVEPTRLGGPNAVRVFVAASTYFVPALALAEVAAFLGVPDVADQDFVGMRCRPEQRIALDARLATWPHAFEIIRADLDGQYSCPPPPGAPAENAVYCVAAAYVDQPDTVISRTLAAALEFGAGLLEDSATADVMRRRYGIYPAFSGLGLTVLGSADGRPTTAAEALQAAISPEYLVHNATLAEGGCRCIRVPPYAGRSMDPLDPRFVGQQGDLGSCRVVPKLRFANS